MKNQTHFKTTLVFTIAASLAAASFVPLASLFHAQTAINPNSISVEDTLILANNTLVPGNDHYPSPILQPFYPAMVIDPRTGNLFAPGADNNQFVVFNLVSNKTLLLGNNPNGLVYDPVNDAVFASYGNMTVYNGSSAELEKSFGAGYLPGALAVDSSNGDVYVSDDTNSIAVISPDFRVIANITSPRSEPLAPAGALCYDPKNNEVYVGVSGGHSISIINATTNRLVGTIGLNATPGAIVYDPGNNYLYVSRVSLFSNNISIIDPQLGNKVIGNVKESDYGPYDLAYDPSNGYIYASNYFLGGTQEISGTTVINFLNYTVGPLAYDPANGYMYTSIQSLYGINGALVALDGTNNVARLYLYRATPIAMDLDPNNGMLYVTDESLQEIYAISTLTNTIDANIVNSTNFNLGGFQSIAFDSSNSQLYAAGNGGILIVNATTNKIVRSIQGPGSGYPYGMVYDPSNHDIYVGYADPSNQVFVLNGISNQVEARIAFPPGGNSMTVDSYNGNVFVSATNSTLVVNASTNQIVANQIFAPFTPQNPFFDASNGNVYLPLPDAKAVVVMNAANQIVDDIQTSYPTYSLTFASNTQVFYMVSYLNGSLSVVSPNSYTMISDLSIGSYPSHILYDPANGLTYVSNSGSGTISIVGSSLYSVTSTPSVSVAISQSSSQFPKTPTSSFTTTLSNSARQSQGDTFANEFGIIVISTAVVAMALILTFEFVRRRKR